LPPVVAKEDRSSEQVTLGAVRGEAFMQEIGERFETKAYDRQGAFAEATRKLQIEALRFKASGVVVTHCGVSAQPRLVVCEGEAIGKRRTSR
jgi:hypothetical protein